MNTALRAFTHPGDAVIIQRPVYYPFTNAAMNNGLEILNNALLFDGETGRYSMDFEDLERKASDPRCKAIMLCNPHNRWAVCGRPRSCVCSATSAWPTM